MVFLEVLKNGLNNLKTNKIMKIKVRLKDIEIEMNDENTESFNKYDGRAENVIKIIKIMSEEVLKLNIENFKNK